MTLFKRLFRTLTLLVILGPLLALFLYTALRSGPLAPVPVTVTIVEEKPITPALFGIGTVEARYTYRIGPTMAGRVLRVEVDAGDRVTKGQVLGEMDPVDLDDRLQAQAAGIKRAQASIKAAEAQVQESAARRDYTASQAKRYEDLIQSRAVSQDGLEAKRQEAHVAEAGWQASKANLDSLHHEYQRLQAEWEALRQQRADLRLIAPVDGLVIRRAVDPGTTVVAGQAVVELIDPTQLWIHVRFDQNQAHGLEAQQPAHIVLRSRNDTAYAGHVLRVEPIADAITEEILAKVVFDALPAALPPLGELTEVTVLLPALEAKPIVPNASIQRQGNTLGVWVVKDDQIEFVPVQTGISDLEGQVQILDGLSQGTHVVVYSQRELDFYSRIHIVEKIPGVPS
ncbi:MAG: efflux RND transporter periplasmic adaptor subunit [bacterium]|jgi:RND family efflux transporter MFP subunit|nr:efflux RND transporter periplasmic adaptor subunit [bacterium]